MSRHTISLPERAPLNEVARWLSLDYQWLYAKVRGEVIPAENLGTKKRAVWWVSPADVLDHLAQTRKSA